MTQIPDDILLSIEQLLDADRQKEAQSLLVEFIKAHPASARAWWLMSLTLTDINQQVDCLERVVRLDPKNDLARERLSKLVNPPPLVPQERPTFEAAPVGKEEPPVEEPLQTPAWAAGEAKPEYEVPKQEVKPSPEEKEQPPVEEPVQVPAWAGKEENPEFETRLFETKPPPPEVQPVPPVPSIPLPALKPETKAVPPRRKKSGWGIALVFMAVFVIIVAALFAGYWWLQRDKTTPAQLETLGYQQTLMVAQTLTSFPLPTLISTWTASPTPTFMPSHTIELTPTLPLRYQSTSIRTPPSPDQVGPVEGMFAPDFSLADLATGQQVTLYQFDAQPVLLVFWLTWCPTCASDIDTLDVIANTYRDSGLVVLLVDVGEDPQTVNTFLSVHPVVFPVLLDLDSSVQNLYLVDAVPGYFFIDSNGLIKVIGRGEMTPADIQAEVDAIVPRHPTVTP